MSKIAVIGGGPAGMMAAYTAKLTNPGHQIILLDKNQLLGRKLALAGGTRCNITHSGSTREFSAHYPEAGKFLLSPLHQLDNEGLRSFFSSQLGLSTLVEDDGRVFPTTQSGEAVARRFTELLGETGVEIRPERHVQVLEKTETGFLVDDEGFDSVIIATGGASYPQTGSTGDGQKLAQKLGHTSTQLLPGLTGINLQEAWISQLSGVTLSDAALTLYIPGERKPAATSRGELLFTHFGLSGPASLNLSRWVAKYSLLAPSLTLSLNLLPEKNQEETLTALASLIRETPRAQIKTILRNLVPEALTTALCEQKDLDPAKSGAQMSKKELRQAADYLIQMPLTVRGLRPLATAKVTVGGVGLKEINPKTMESKLVPRLFFAGEVMDIDGHSGGYNIQAAFSTGYTAGKWSASL